MWSSTQIKLDAPNNLGKLEIMSSEIIMPLDIKHQTIPEIYLNRSSFQDTDFRKVLDCTELHVTEGITLRSVNYGIPPNFIDIHLSAAAQNKGDRETFSQIKHSFEAIANSIEANRFFALEMEAYLWELRSRKCKISKERVLVEIDHAISRHGQNYIRPFVGILLVGLVNMFLITFKEKFHLPEVLSDSTLFQTLSALPVTSMTLPVDYPYSKC